MRTMQPPPSYPRGDLRRVLMTLAAVDVLGEQATLVKLASCTGLDKKSITLLLSTAAEQAGVWIEKSGPVYRIKDWGPVFKRQGAELALKGALSAPKMTRLDDKESR
jgi:hypothetical protein